MPRLFFGLSLTMLALDQFLKFWVRVAADETAGRSVAVLWPEVFELKLVYNEGIAFGMLQGIGLWLAPIALIIAGWAGYFSLKNPNEPRVAHITMALLAAGAIGNLIDRLALGKVTDMFWIRAINFPVFNVADACITVAGVLMTYRILAEIFTKRPVKAPGASSAETPPSDDSQ
ncbi:MAG: signal peptidase II [Armatimonadetes bacterium]|nr:signal peptidase II [Armatimonadota bacterium]